MILVKRSKSRWLALSVVVLLLNTGCVSLSDVMSSWVGKSESELLSRWGAPDSSAQTGDGKRVLTWKNIWSNGYGNLYTCRKSFTIGSDGKVERWSYASC
jgi:hypothetical protein